MQTTVLPNAKAGAACHEAVSLANRVRFGLSAAVMCRDLGTVLAVVPSIEAGMVHVNRPTTGADVHMPFGGVKASGSPHREWGTAARAFFSEESTVYLRG